MRTSLFMVAPSLSEIFDRAVTEGERRLDQSWLALVSSSFIAGTTIVFGIIALSIVRAAVESYGSGVATIAGALAFGIGLVLLIIGRAELVTENFFDPVATVAERNKPGDLKRLFRLWGVTFVLNLVGGGLLAVFLSIEGVLPEGAPGVLNTLAEEIAERRAAVGFFKAIIGGALITLLSFLLQAVNSVSSRMVVAYMIGFLLTLGHFDHIIVTDMLLIFGLLLGAEVGLGTLVGSTAIVTAGNLVGGLGLVTLTHIEQARGVRQSQNNEKGTEPS